MRTELRGRDVATAEAKDALRLIASGSVEPASARRLAAQIVPEGVGLSPVGGKLVGWIAEGVWALHGYATGQIGLEACASDALDEFQSE